ncbi:MAG TPA: ATP-binding protein, partial [Chloroflexota bacterium]|nr:ATP-binding protein [Chloroflexota bacterium]
NMADINTDMLAMSRRGLLNQQPVDLNSVVRQALDQIAETPDTLRVVTELAGDLFSVEGSQGQLLRVVSNLVHNACDAMRNVGILRITTSNLYVDKTIGRYNRVEVGEYVRLTIEDNGCGISQEIRDKIFDAFFTTKHTSRRRGSGLGLTVVQALVEDHRGYIDLESEEGKGTTFSVYLPAHRPAIKEVETTRLESGNESVLVVDDDPIQRQVMAELLAALGYRVHDASSGEKAVDFVRRQSVDLVILDMVMPGGMDGTESYRQISTICPGQKALVLSGFAETERVREAQRLGAGTYLPKPVSIDQLAKAVREELDR